MTFDAFKSCWKYCIYESNALERRDHEWETWDFLCLSVCVHVSKNMSDAIDAASVLMVHLLK